MNTEQTARRRFWKESLIPRLPAAGQLAALVVVATVLLLPAPFTQNQLPAVWPWSDLLVNHWPDALLIQRTFAQAHTLPLWNPYFAGGQPLGADPLAALFYPPTHLVHLLSLRDYFLVLILGHLVWAGLGMLLLAQRAFGLPRLPALVAAVSFMASPALIGHLGAGHITMLQTIAWYPWLALLCWATVREPRRWGVLLGLCIALTLLAGHPQMAYYGLLMTGMLAAWLLVKRWRLDGLRAAVASTAGVTAAGGIGVLLAAIHLLPLLEFTSHSTRQLALASTDGYPLLDFLRALITQRPAGSTFAYQQWEYMVTPGLIVLALALIGVVTRLRKVWPLLLSIVVVAALVMGTASWFYLYAVRILPLLDLFRAPARTWFVALVPIALLAGSGADSLLRGMRRISFEPFRTPVMAAAGSLLVVIVVLSLIVTDISYTHTGDISVATTPSLLARTAFQLAGDGRIYSLQENIPQLSAVQMQRPHADGLDPLLIESYVSFMERAGGYSARGYQLSIPVDAPTVQPHAMLLGLMNVSVVVSRRPLTDPYLVQVEELNNTRIYKNTANAGPAYLVRPGPRAQPPSLNGIQRINAGVRTITLAPEQEIFTFATSTEAYFVIAMPAFPGWAASLDGHPAPIEQIAGVLPSVQVGPGTHTLSYNYAPFSVRSGAMLSLVGLLAALAWLIAGRAWKTRKSRRPRQEEEGEEAPGLLEPQEVAGDPAS